MVVWSAPSEADEAGWIANLVLDLTDAGVRFRDIAVLVRSRAAYGRLVEQFATFDIPVQPGGRSGLFDQPEAVVLGHTITWLADRIANWTADDVQRDGYGEGASESSGVGPSLSQGQERDVEWRFDQGHDDQGRGHDHDRIRHR